MRAAAVAAALVSEVAAAEALAAVDVLSKPVCTRSAAVAILSKPVCTRSAEADAALLADAVAEDEEALADVSALEA